MAKRSVQMTKLTKGDIQFLHSAFDTMDQVPPEGESWAPLIMDDKGLRLGKPTNSNPAGVMELHGPRKIFVAASA